MKSKIRHHTPSKPSLSPVWDLLKTMIAAPVRWRWPKLLMLGGLAGHSAMAETYYISNEGNDTADGLTESTAWTTLEKVNSVTYAPGDKILFRRGDTWRGELIVSSSGSSENYIVYSAYGSGDKPRILGSTEITAWTEVSANIWAGDTDVPKNPITTGYSGAQVFIKGTDGSVTWGHYEDYSSDYSNLADEYDWTWSNGTIYLYSSTDPNSMYDGVEAPQVERLVRLNGMDFVGIDNLAIKFVITAGIYDNYAGGPNTDLRVTHCDIGFVGIRGGGAAYGIETYHSNSYYGHNEIHDCGRRGISQNLYANTPAITCENVIIEHNHFYNGYHTTGVDIANSGTHTLKNYSIRKNFFEGNPDEDLQGEAAFNSNHLFIQQDGPGGYVGGIEVYNNIFTYAHGSAVKILHSGDIKICHNTFYKFNKTLANYQAYIFSTQPPEPILIGNNIFYHDTDHRRLADIRMTVGYEEQFEIDYNLYYHEHPDTRLYWCDSGSYDAAQAEAYRENTGFDVNSIFQADPKFTNGSNNDFSLKTGSPAVGAGTADPRIKSDYFDNPISVPPDLGAIQKRSNDLVWAGYSVAENGHVDTGLWMGLLYVRAAPYVYCYNLPGYLYVEENLVTETGAWFYRYH